MWYAYTCSEEDLYDRVISIWKLKRRYALLCVAFSAIAEKLSSTSDTDNDKKFYFFFHGDLTLVPFFFIDTLFLYYAISIVHTVLSFIMLGRNLHDNISYDFFNSVHILGKNRVGKLKKCVGRVYVFINIRRMII